MSGDVQIRGITAAELCDLRLTYSNIRRRDADLIIATQGYRCAICGDRERLVIDHCHKTDLVRGALCGRCNAGLGMFKDSVIRLRGAIGYLTEFALDMELRDCPRDAAH